MQKTFARESGKWRHARKMSYWEEEVIQKIWLFSFEVWTKIKQKKRVRRRIKKNLDHRNIAPHSLELRSCIWRQIDGIAAKEYTRMPYDIET